MKTKKEILAILHQSKDKLKQKFHIKNIWLFGSFVRKEQRKKSDVDVLVDFDEGATLFDWVGAGLYLENKLGRRVDVVSRRALRKEFKRDVLRQRIPV